MDEELIRRLIEQNELLLKQQRKDNARHERHHDFLEQWITREHEKAEFWKGVKEKVYSGGIWSLMWALICAVGTVFWFALTQWVHGKS